LKSTGKQSSIQPKIHEANNDQENGLKYLGETIDQLEKAIEVKVELEKWRIPYAYTYAKIFLN